MSITGSAAISSTLAKPVPVVSGVPARTLNSPPNTSAAK
jgi:hypothetical protein